MHTHAPWSIPRHAALLTAMFLAGAIRLPIANAAVVDPFEGGPADPVWIESEPAVESTNTTANTSPPQQRAIRHADYQPNNQTPFSDDPANDLTAPTAPAKSPSITNDPCAAAPMKPFSQFGINIAQPAGKLPTDLAAPCAQRINQTASSTRCWPVLCCNWEATCLCFQPLYFEEINLERYGYQCGDRSCCCTCGRECCLQPAASAAHFFGTIPMLPYCMAANCPGDCIYTLGHYRPGGCPPWRRNWPLCDPLAAAATAGFYVGMIAVFP